MSYSKLCILACCVGVNWGTFAVAQSASTNNDQAKALEALRKAEAEPLAPDQISAPATAPSPTTEPAADTGRIVAPEPAITSIQAASTNEQNNVLEVPRHAGPMTARDREAQWMQAQRLRRMAEEKAITDRAAQEEFAKRQQAQDALRIKEAIEMERVAAEQVRIARAQEEAAALARRKAQEEAARRAEQLKKAMQNNPTEVEVSNTPMSEKEKKLADLLRRYQADEITPYDYHLQRAKIVAEP